jgi:predicted ATPase
MKRFILTGTPGSGKTAILRQLELEGFGVVEEAATDWIALQQAQGIAEPWTDPGFVDAVADLQRRRVLRSSSAPDEVQFHDRSIFCTRALAEYLRFPVSDAVRREIDRISSEQIFERTVFFVRNLGFVSPTSARRISFEESLRFEQIHENVYREAGFDLVFVGPGKLADRVAAILAFMRRIESCN